MAQFTQTSLFKTCSTCSRLLALTEFYLDRGTHRADCKGCHIARVKRRTVANADAVSAYQAAYREKHRAKARATTARYRAQNPERVQRAQERYRADPEHRRIARERARAFRLANPDRRREYERRRRALEKEASVIGFIEPEQLAAKLDYWGNRCWMCGTDGELHIDHVKPLIKGGLHVLANLRPACPPCNWSKNDRWPFPTSAWVLKCSPSPSRASGNSRSSPRT